MAKKANPASTAVLGGAGTVDQAAERVSPKYRSFQTKRKGRSSNERQRRIEIVHHWSVDTGSTWLIVFRAGGDKKTVAAYGSLDDALEQLGNWSHKLLAKIVGRGSEIWVQP